MKKTNCNFCKRTATVVHRSNGKIILTCQDCIDKVGKQPKIHKPVMPMNLELRSGNHFGKVGKVCFYGK